MAMPSSPNLFKLTGTDDFFSVAENSVKNHIPVQLKDQGCNVALGR